MDFTRFLNSKDIAAHLREINYRFSPEEAFFVIHEGRNIPLKEKHAAYEALIKQYADTPLKERREETFKGHTVASFLRAYMEKENALIEKSKEGEGAIYYSGYYSPEDKDGAWLLADASDPVYRSFGECFDATMKENGEYLSKLRITKKKIATNEQIEVELLPDGTVLGVKNFDYEDTILYAHEWMWVNIPTPFKRGDLLVPCKERIWDRRRPAAEENVFVLMDVNTWGSKELAANGYKNERTKKCPHKRDEKNFAAIDKLIKHHEEQGDSTDMGAWGYFLNEDGTVFQDHTMGDVYLDYEYYKGELTGVRRILKAVSAYEKGEITTDLLLQAYQTILLEEKVKDMHEHHLLVYFDDSLMAAGLKEEGE